jgi:hypothetical protein
MITWNSENGNHLWWCMHLLLSPLFDATQ